MRHFDHRDGELHAEDVPLSRIAAEVGTPVYVYSSATLERHYRVFADSFGGLDTLVAYSVKANSNIAVLQTLARLGAGADVVSGGELARALIAGIPGERIVFSGVGKTRDEMSAALEADIHVFNVESLPELRVLDDVAQSMGRRAPVAFRVNPDVSAGGHEKISTGKKENKFGIAWDRAESAYAEAACLPGIEVVGVDVHIGSQIDDLAPFEAAIRKVRGLIERLRTQGHDIRLFDIGGGLGIHYGDDNRMPPPPSDYGQLVRRLTADLGVQMVFEPGRMIAGNSGVLLTEVLYVKGGGDREFLIVDAAMNDLLRPALYDAWHAVEPVRLPEPDQASATYDIVGPICESGDTFAKDRMMPAVRAGDLVVFHSAGAYGAAQSSQYNTRPLVPEVMVRGGQYRLIRKRPSVEEMLERERLVDWSN
ncbi:diaminopimelate decarboxylase [uncultured Algimonas sp.]|uniref:diaminopimelate decarboxylase n=1 Tax=uncultured Algimonas sp. TaxID=1547920 RepID=UPI00263019B1|nr:diaminopimelate decarboxylase [uncultured Algimonas sp.]